MSRLASRSLSCLAVKGMFKLGQIGGCDWADLWEQSCQMPEQAASLAGQILARLFLAGVAWGLGVALFLQFEP
jgi:hypothetical protein